MPARVECTCQRFCNGSKLVAQNTKWKHARELRREVRSAYERPLPQARKSQNARKRALVPPSLATQLRQTPDPADAGAHDNDFNGSQMFNGTDEPPGMPDHPSSPTAPPENPIDPLLSNRPIEEDIDALLARARMPNIKTNLEFIKLVKEATLDNSGMTDAQLQRLRNPASVELTDASSSLLHSLSSFITTSGNIPDSAYNAFRADTLQYNPEIEMLSWKQVKARVDELTGIVVLRSTMCESGCMAFTGPWKDLRSCIVCGKSPYHPRTQKPIKEFCTYLLGPQLQALYSNAENAQRMQYRFQETEKLRRARSTPGASSVRDDFVHGTAYLDAVQAGKITKDHILLMQSGDGAQLYRDKPSDTWIFIWCLFELPPWLRYKVNSVIPDTVVPGPDAPKNHISFAFPSLYHLAALQNEGLKVWDGDRKKITTKWPFLAFCCFDSPFLASMWGSVGHTGRCGCRFYCGHPGRRKAGLGIYYPVASKPDNYNIEGSTHDDVDLILYADGGDAGTYNRNMRQVILESVSKATADRQRLATGLGTPSIYSGLPLKLDIPLCFPPDVLHLPGLNLPKLLSDLWTGAIKGDEDDKKTWDFAVLKDDTWVTHGQLVDEAQQYIPSSFGRYPRNPQKKLNSGFKACEFMIWLYGICPGLLYSVLPDEYWTNFCDLVQGLRLILARELHDKDIRQAHTHFLQFVYDFEELYYQRKAERLHFVHQCVHLLIHLAPLSLRLGPLTLLAQWLMERTIGNLGQEVRLPSDPFANLQMRVKFRAQKNALGAMFPELRKRSEALPQRSVDAGSGYWLLPKKDRHLNSFRHSQPAEVFDTIVSFIESNSSSCDELTVGRRGKNIHIQRFSRLRLANGQTARSLWGEKNRLKKIRIARMVKLEYEGHQRYAEAQFFFGLHLDGRKRYFALMSLFGTPDEHLRAKSRNALLVCAFKGCARESLAVLPVHNIGSVVGMVPFVHDVDREDRYFVVEKIGHVTGDESPPDAPDEEEEVGGEPDVED